MATGRLAGSRIARAGKLGRLAADHPVRGWGVRMANTTRSDDAAHAALERHSLETADRIVTVLGTMKGAAMKIGQSLSLIDVGLVPEEFREEFQAKLAKLQSAAPQVSF